MSETITRRRSFAQVPDALVTDSRLVARHGIGEYLSNGDAA